MFKLKSLRILSLIAPCLITSGLMSYMQNKGLNDNSFNLALAESNNNVEDQQNAWDEKVESVISKIDEIGISLDASEACRKRILAARNAYDALEEEEKMEVINYPALLMAEQQFAVKFSSPNRINGKSMMIIVVSVIGSGLIALAGINIVLYRLNKKEEVNLLH